MINGARETYARVPPDLLGPFLTARDMLGMTQQLGRCSLTSAGPHHGGLFATLSARPLVTFHGVDPLGKVLGDLTPQKVS